MRRPFEKGKFWLGSLFVAAIVILAASFGLSLALSHGWGRRFLLARLSGSFGRPIEVGRFAFSLFPDPSLEADAVTVEEDPQFGNEYFLRADQLRATLHWSALLRGRVEFGTLSFTDPSLNLVRATDGRWNIESWLPPAPARSSAADPASVDSTYSVFPASRSPAERRLSHIVVDGGRINFKLGATKILFALTNVRAHVDQDGSGRWDLDVLADPMRASVALQESGTIHLRGTVAGTSARLRPAALSLTWEDASLADALRLTGGQDYGVRGVLGAEITAQIEDPVEGPAPAKTAALPANPALAAAPLSQWRISGKLHLAGIHRWDLPGRDSDPGLSFTFAAELRPASAQVAVEHALLETAHSQVYAAADASWSHGFEPDIRVLGSSISLDDLLEWAGSFRPVLPQGFSAEGSLGLRTEFSGWPLRIGPTGITAPGAVLHFPGLAGPVRVGPVSASLRGGSLVLDPLLLNLPGGPRSSRARENRDSGRAASSLPASAGVLRLEGSLGPLLAKSPADWTYRLVLSGRTTRAQDLLIASGIFGRLLRPDSRSDAPPTWKIQGPAALQLAWQGTPRQPAASPSGTLILSGLEVSSSILNQPFLVRSASVDLLPGERHVKLDAGQALGASWKGTLDWDASARIWRFDLAADHLDAAELDRWLGPRARPGFFARLLGGDDAAAPARDAAIQRLAARGQLHVAELSLAPLDLPMDSPLRLPLQRVEASVELAGRRLALRSARAEVADGRVLGDFTAQLTSDPSYSFRGQFDRLNLAEVTASENEPDGRLGGLASGNLELSARGIGSPSLLASLSAHAEFRVRDPILHDAMRSIDQSTMRSIGQGTTRSIDQGLTRGSDLLSAWLAAGDSRIPRETHFRAAEASLDLSRGIVHINRLSLLGRDANLEAQGSVDFARHLDLRAWSVPRAAGALADSEAVPEHTAERILPQRTPERSFDRTLDRPEWSIGGTIDAPLVTRLSPLAGDPLVSSPGSADASAPAPPASPPFQRR